MMQSRKGWWIVLVVMFWGLSACGGSGGSTASSSSTAISSSPSSQSSSDASSLSSHSSSSSSTLSSTSSSSSSSDSGVPVLTLTPTAIKTLVFTWPGVAGASEYVLLEDADGSSGYSELVRLPAPADTYQHRVFLPDYIGARYLLQACAGADCTDSEPVYVSGYLAEAVGYMKAQYPTSSDGFGRALAVSGDGKTIAVGAPLNNSIATGINGDQQNSDAPNSGAVYVFHHGESGWEQQAFLKASNSDAEDRFGSSLALSYDGHTLAVGSVRESSAALGVGGDASNNEVLNGGAAYVFARSGNVWQQQAYIKAINTRAQAWFGTSVALSDDGAILAVGAPNDTSLGTGVNGSSIQGFFGTGAVYILERLGDLWQHQTFIRSDSSHDQRFGEALALSGDGATLAVGAYLESSNATGINGSPHNNSVFASGAVYVYANALGVWNKQAYIKPAVVLTQQRFGWSVALDEPGHTLVVGAPFDASAGTTPATSGLVDSGAAYVYTRAAGVWSHSAYLKASNRDQNDEFGWSVAITANGQTLAVGAPGEWVQAVGINGDASARDDDAGQRGAAYLFRREAGSWYESSYIKASGNFGYGSFGYSLGLDASARLLVVGDPSEGGVSGGIGGDQSDQASFGSGAAYLY